MTDKRTALQKKLDEAIGPPLYYCENCKLAVEVIDNNGDVTINRPCDCNAQVIAPRRAICTGDGTMKGVSYEDRLKMLLSVFVAKLLKRHV